MLRSLWLLAVFLAFMGLGTQAPFIFALGYVWVDTFRPQEVAYQFLNQIPVAMIMGAATFGSYFVLDRRSPPRVNFITVVQLCLALWSTATLLWAVAPDEAWSKWDWAFKTMIFSVFVPFVIRSRIQIEAFLQVYFFALAATLLPFSGKILVSGGGYGQTLGLSGANFGLGEGATLAAVAVTTIPMALYLAKHSLIMLKNPLFKVMYYGMAVAALITTIGTFQRTGLVGLLILSVGLILKSRKKILMFVMTAVVGAIVAYNVSDSWTARISTIGTYQQDSSALVRILVWQWTYDYTLSHPLGGGFNMYVINRIELPTATNGLEVEVQNGRAFHSIYFEVMGEHGWIGFAMFVGLLIFAQYSLWRLGRRVKHIPDMAWCKDLADMLQICLAIMSVCGSFIGIAFQPFIHYLLALTVCTSEFARRAMTVPRAPGGWRDRAIHAGGRRGIADATARSATATSALQARGSD